jgi:hypothetical protein
MNERIKLLEYLLAAVRIPLKSKDAKTRRAAREYERFFATELRKPGPRGKTTTQTARRTASGTNGQSRA